jgi:dihydrofolate synthase/folylpolyglutamate synthase
MPARWLPEDEPFFREYNARREGERRDLARAAQLKALLGLSEVKVPIVTVVGSKGKGTAATYAAAVLTACGRRTALITSPPLRTNRERLKIEGATIDQAQYAELSRRLDAALAALPPAGAGYLSPTGAYTITCMAYAVSAGCDAVVLEEGLGGASDEASLFAPDVVAVTPVFEEHLGVLGDSVGDVARDLTGVVRAGTEVVVTAPQRPEVMQIVKEAARRHGAQVRVPSPDGDWASLVARARGLSAENARVGIEAALALLGSREPLDDVRVHRTLGSINLPGRLSVAEHDGRRWVVDAAIDPTGARAALGWCREAVGPPDVVLAGVPDVKPVSATLAAFGDLPVVGVRAGETYLRYDDDAWAAPPVPLSAAVEALPDAARVVLCAGTMSFVGEVAEHLDLDCSCAFRAPPRRP